MTDDVEDVGRKAALSIFGDIIRRKRQSCRWTFHALSEKTGIEAAALSALEDGSDSVSDVEREKLCEFLGVHVDTFAKIVRQENAKANPPPQAVEDLQSSAVVDLARYREWQKTTSHPVD
ncbi:helix-turn-helix transcriptional regulator [Rhizobium leguminosarum]|uniref:helix-turn-helix domain-containing protein n=1 Tax=Rhizobium leguminosarum TaxID=384 RepID=UPI0024A8EEB8|nr:helix-turn-helix transcriptional regulator [Rhizobium leguminosarum]MDI5929042.1 helix-turn-helix transcriptional regulator [Rhizobium leguminosarum]